MEKNKQVENDVKQKKSKVFLILIITLIIGLLLGVGGSYYYFEVMKKESTSVTDNKKEEDNSKENSEIKNLDILSDLVQNNFKKFMISANHYCGAQDEYFKTQKVTVSDIDNILAYSTVSYYFFNNKENISAKDFEEIVKKYFGRDYKYEHQNFTYKICTDHHYNKETNSYDYSELGCGGICGPFRIEYQITKAELIGEEIVLNVKVLFPGDYNDRDTNGFVKYYSDANLTKNITDLYYNTLNIDPSDAAITYSDHNFAKGGNYKFVMKKYDDNNYSFVSSEPID